jgi:hypothetical protein
MSYLNSLSPYELALLGNLIAISLSENLNADDLNVLGNLIVDIGGVMLTIAAQQQNLQNIKDRKDQILELKKQIEQLEKSL